MSTSNHWPYQFVRLLLLCATTAVVFPTAVLAFPGRNVIRSSNRRYLMDDAYAHIRHDSDLRFREKNIDPKRTYNEDYMPLMRSPCRPEVDGYFGTTYGGKSTTLTIHYGMTIETTPEADLASVNEAIEDLIVDLVLAKTFPYLCGFDNQQNDEEDGANGSSSYTEEHHRQRRHMEVTNRVISGFWFGPLEEIPNEPCVPTVDNQHDYCGVYYGSINVYGKLAASELAAESAASSSSSQIVKDAFNLLDTIEHNLNNDRPGFIHEDLLNVVTVPEFQQLITADGIDLVSASASTRMNGNNSNSGLSGDDNMVTRIKWSGLGLAVLTVGAGMLWLFLDRQRKHRLQLLQQRRPSTPSSRRMMVVPSRQRSGLSRSSSKSGSYTSEQHQSNSMLSNNNSKSILDNDLVTVNSEDSDCYTTGKSIMMKTPLPSLFEEKEEEQEEIVYDSINQETVSLVESVPDDELLYDTESHRSVVSKTSRRNLLNNIRTASDSFRGQHYQYHRHQQQQDQSKSFGGVSTVGSMVYSTTSSEATRRTRQQHHHQQHRQQHQQSSRLRVTFDGDDSSSNSSSRGGGSSRWGKRRDPPTQDEIDNELSSIGQYSSYSAEMVSSIDGPLHHSSKKYGNEFRRIV